MKGRAARTTTASAPRAGAGAGGYILAALLGAVAGGLGVAFATNAIPDMVSRVGSAMMRTMMATMEERGCSLPDV